MIKKIFEGKFIRGVCPLEDKSGVIRLRELLDLTSYGTIISDKSDLSFCLEKIKGQAANIDLPINIDIFFTLVNATQDENQEVYKSFRNYKMNKLARLIDSFLEIDIKSDLENLIESFLVKYISSDIPTDQDFLQEMNYLAKDLSKINKKKIRFVSLKNILWQLGLDDIISYEDQKKISFLMNTELNYVLDEHRINLINYQKYIKEFPKVNPLISGYLKFNNYLRNPESSDYTYWSSIQPYWNFDHTPSDGINVYSFASDPLRAYHAGTANLSKIDEFIGAYNIHPLVSTEYPAEMVTIVQSLNLIRVMSGLMGKAWMYSSANMRGE